MTTSPGQSDTGAQLRRALTALKDLRTRLTTVEGERREPIAIIGMGCRFPGASNPEAFWTLLRDGVDAIRPTPEGRWDAAALYDPDPEAPGKVSTRWGGFLDAIDEFDAAFFGIAPREAAQMDPQQRLLLEVAWETLEDGGQVAERLAGSKTGVFVGVHSHSGDYYLMQAADPRHLDLYSGTGTSHSVVSGRLSYLLDLRGPSIAIDTACSSSLVAIHLAVQSLRSQECALALAGGVNSMLDPTFTIAASRMRMMAADGRCKPFDASADGFVRGEGCGLVLLKRLSDALADGDRILAVINGTAVNQDGRTNGLTAPNSLSQQAVIGEALANAGLSANQIGLIEAHGTGTPLGDPIEVEALSAVFGPLQMPAQVCVLGSAKANIGHLEGAAGVAGLIKAVLTLRHNAIPPLLHFQALNPHITLEGTPFAIPTALQSWPAGEQPRYAGVSSFGWSGTNAHIVLGEAPELQQAPPIQSAATYLLPISARSPAALRELARAYQPLVAAASDSELRDICYSAALHRSHHEQRLAAVGRSGNELAGQIVAFLAGEPRQGLASGNANSPQHGLLVFVFPGQGSQWPGMARQLLAHEPSFRAAIERCEQAFAPYVEWSLIEQITGDEARLAEIDVIQPILFAIQVALAELWRGWGVVPDAVVGHSMGEVAAAHVAGILTLDDAARIICRRSRLLRRVSGHGAMAVVGLSAEAAEQVIEAQADRLAVAVSNSAHSTVLSGDPLALDQVLEQLKARNIFCRSVKVDVASHSPQVDKLLPELRELLADIVPEAASIPFYSTVTGGVLRGEEARTRCEAAYWVENLRRPVRFLTSVRQLLADGHHTFVELSPHPLLLAAVEETAQESGTKASILPSLQREGDDSASMRAALGKLYTLGMAIRWHELHPSTGCYTTLPIYPWQRTRYWLAAESRRSVAVAPESIGAGLLGRRLPALAPLPGVRMWAGTLDEATLPITLRSPVEAGEILAGAVYAWLGLQAAAQSAPADGWKLRDLIVDADLALTRGLQWSTQVLIEAVSEGEKLRVFSRAGDEEAWIEHVRALLVAEGANQPHKDILAMAQATCQTGAVPLAGFEDLRLGNGQALGRLAASLGSDDLASPGALADGIALLATLDDRSDNKPILAAIDQMTPGVAAPPAWVYARVDQTRADVPVGEVYLFDEEGRLVLACAGVRLRYPDVELRAQVAQARMADWLYELQWRSLASVPPTQPATGRWLICADRAGLGSELARLIEAEGGEVTLVYAGSIFEQAANGSMRVDPGNPDDLRRLVETSNAAGASPTRVVYLWGLDASADEPIEGEALLDRQNVPLGGILHLTQALVRTSRVTPRLWLVTRGAAQTGSPVETAGVMTPRGVEQATLWGLGRVLANEHPELWGGLIDLDDAAPAETARGLMAALLAGDGEDQLALRGGARLGARLSRTRLPAPAKLRLRTDATYLITGGLGGVGLVLARWLLTNGARHLALLGRRMPDANTQATLRTLEEEGARVMYLQADVAQSTALAAALAELADAMPPLRGVIHAAGVLDDAALLGQNWASFERVMSAKVAGAWNLHRETAHHDLDMFVLCSSASALLGTPGQANYAAANTFLDTLAHMRHAAGMPALSINWGRWGEVGLATETLRSEQLERRGLTAMPPATGAAAFGRLLGYEGAQVTVADINWSTFVGQLPRAAATPLFSELTETGVAIQTRQSEPQASLRYTIEQALPSHRYEMLLEHVQASVAAVLRFDKPERIAPEQGFFQLGLDSLTALELKNRLGQSLGRSFPATLVFDYPTAATLTKHLLAEILPISADKPPAVPESEDELAALEQISRDDLKSLLDAELDAIDL